MKSYTTLRNLAGSLINSTNSTTLTLMDQLISDSIRLIASLRGGKWPWLEITKTVTTVADQSGYQIPNPIRKIVDLYVTVGTTIYRPKPVRDSDSWNKILAMELGSDDAAQFFYVLGNQFYLQPAPATSAYTITIRGRKKIRDLGIADYSTGTIVSVANAGVAVVGSGTSWSASMAGRFIRITESDTANKGDGEWYEIASVESTTALTLVKPYQGTAIATGSAAYVIGQMSPIPESYDMAPVYRAVAIYWGMNGQVARSQYYWRLYDGGYEAGLTKIIGGILGDLLQDSGEKIEGAVFEPDDIEPTNPNFPPDTVPSSSFT